MIKSVIQLIIERKVNMENVQNSAELYLMNLLKNMIFHTDETTSLTELVPPEHQDYLVMCLKLCQQALQGASSIKGVVRVVKLHGRDCRCFEATVFDEVVQIPFDFIKTLGIFEFFTENGNAQSDLKMPLH